MRLIKQLLCIAVVVLVIAMPFIYVGGIITIVIHFIRKFW